jgi:hypothetical protein
MTESLREEIKHIIHSNIQGNETGLSGEDEATDEIISVFEKRIDRVKEKYPEPVYEKCITSTQYAALLEVKKFYNQVKEVLK